MRSIQEISEEIYSNKIEKLQFYKLRLEYIYLKTKIYVQKVFALMVLVAFVVEIFVIIHLLSTNNIFIPKSFSNSYVNFIKEKNYQAKIGLISIDKAITTEYIDSIIEQMEKLKKDKEYIAIILRFNSGGGSPSASEDFMEYLREYQKIKPIFGYIESMAASGAYYIASILKPLYANKNSIVGSIGVIMPHYVIGGLADKIGVAQDNIAVGEYKEPLSFFEKASVSQKKYLEYHLLNPVYENFLQTVIENREINISKEEFNEKFANGKIFVSNHKEIKNYLIDEITTLPQLKTKILDYLKKNEKEVLFENINDAKDKSKFNFDINFNNNLLKDIEEKSTINLK